MLPDWSHHDPGPSGPSVLPGSQTILCSPTPLHCNFIPSFSNFQRLLSHPYSQLRPCFPGHVRNHSLPNLKIYHSALPPTPYHCKLALLRPKISPFVHSFDPILLKLLKDFLLLSLLYHFLFSPLSHRPSPSLQILTINSST